MIIADLIGDVCARIVARDFWELTGRKDLFAMENRDADESHDRRQGRRPESV